MKKILVKDQLGNIIEYPQPKHPDQKTQQTKQETPQQEENNNWIEDSTMPDLFDLLQ